MATAQTAAKKAEAATKEAVETVQQATENAKKAYEDIAEAGNQAVKEGFERTMKSVGDFSDFNKESFDAVVLSANAVAKNGEVLATESITFAKRQIEDSVEAAKAALSAKSMQDLFEIQADYVKKAFDAYVSQVNAMSDKMIEAAKESGEPLQGRMNALVEMMQGAK